MKTNLFTAIAFSAFSLFLMSSCSQSDSTPLDETDSSQLALLSVDAEGISTMTRSNVVPVLTVTSPLDADEIEFLYAMREDEKLAHDVYAVFVDKYPTAPQISRIMNAEESHIACVDSLLDYYEIEYTPLTEAGVFSDPTRQASYNQLITQDTTLVQTFSTMAFMEEESVAAYKEVLPDIANENIALVVSNLMKASSNHLKAAVRQITALGGTYVPVVLSREDFDAIINAPFTHGNAYGQYKGKGGNTNSRKGGKATGAKGKVNQAGDCTQTVNGYAPGQNQDKKVGKGYRKGKN